MAGRWVARVLDFEKGWRWVAAGVAAGVGGETDGFRYHRMAHAFGNSQWWVVVWGGGRWCVVGGGVRWWAEGVGD